MVTLNHPYRSLAAPGGEDQGDSAGPTRAQSGRSVEVERPFVDVEVSLLRASMITLSHPYRSLASQGGEDQGWLRGAVRDQSGGSVEVERPFVRVYGVSLKNLRATLSDPYRRLASQGGTTRVNTRGLFKTKVVVLLR